MSSDFFLHLILPLISPWKEQRAAICRCSDRQDPPRGLWSCYEKVLATNDWPSIRYFTVIIISKTIVNKPYLSMVYTSSFTKVAHQSSVVYLHPRTAESRGSNRSWKRTQSQCIQDQFWINVHRTDRSESFFNRSFQLHTLAQPTCARPRVSPSFPTGISV